MPANSKKDKNLTIAELKLILTETVLNRPTNFRYYYKDEVGNNRPKMRSISTIFTAVDMGRGLVHFAYQSEAIAFTVLVLTSFIFSSIMATHMMISYGQLKLLFHAVAI